jgi:hypothetical protein
MTRKAMLEIEVHLRGGRLQGDSIEMIRPTDLVEGQIVESLSSMMRMQVQARRKTSTGLAELH